MTPKPPATPPNSDIEGVNRDRVPVDHPENAKPDPGTQLDEADRQSKGQPDSGGR